MDIPQQKEVVNFVSNHPQFNFPRERKILPNGEIFEAPELSKDQKREKLSQLLQKDAGIFLERYGKLLEEKELSYFRVYTDNYEVNWHLNELTAKMKSSMHIQQKQVQVKNRRFRYMEKLITQGEYFSDETMQLRQPALYQRYVGKYEKNERRKFKDNAKLSERLLINNDLCDAEEEAKADMDKEEEFEDSDSENEIMEEEDNMEQDHMNAREKDHSDFLEMMKVRFLQGMDSSFVDYDQIDNDEDLDDWKQIERDAQDRYFEDENLSDILYTLPEEIFFFEEGKIVTSGTEKFGIYFDKGMNSSRKLVFGDSIVSISSTSSFAIQDVRNFPWEIQFTESMVANIKKRPSGTLDKRILYLLWDIGNEGSIWIRGITRKAFRKTARTLKEQCGLFVDKRKHSFLNTPISNNIHKLPIELQNYLSSVVNCKVCGNTYFSECKSCGIVQLEIGHSTSKDRNRPSDFTVDNKFPPLYMKWDIFLQAIRAMKEKVKKNV